MFILKNSYDDYLGSLETTHQKKLCVEKRKEHTTYIKKIPNEIDPWIPVTNYKYYYGQKKLFRNIVTVKFQTIKTISDIDDRQYYLELVVCTWELGTEWEC